MINFSRPLRGLTSLSQATDGTPNCSSIMADESRDQNEAALDNEESAREPEAAEAPDVTEDPSEIDQLRTDLDVAREEARHNHELYLREAAETENYKKRVTREKQDAIRYANESLVRDLLPVIDDLERAALHTPADGNAQALTDGIELVLKGCLEALQKHAVTPVEAKGKPFDPEKHEAYTQVETDAYEANTVVGEVHRGYYLADRLLRPSLVSVAKAPISQGKVHNEKDQPPVENDQGDD